MGRPKLDDPRNINITFRVNKEELKMINQSFISQKSFGFKTKNEFYRQTLIKDSSEILKQFELKTLQKDYVNYQKYAFQLQKLGTNFNQLMRFINKDKSTSRLSLKDINTMKTIFSNLDVLLKSIKDDS
tara:strand:+ start:67 stop:453 length:387 start_codon:yes stop_codon:yes gene_type:complete